MKKYELSDRVMHSILDDKSETLGDKVFVRHKEDQVTYGELSQGSNKIANFFTHELGVIKEDKIAVILPNCVDYFYTQFGISKSGAVMVPINVLAKLDLLTHFLNNSDAKIVVIDEQFLPLIESIAETIPNIKTLIVRTPEFKRNKFTPLESPTARSGDDDTIPFSANMGSKAPCEPSRWKVENFLTGFTFRKEFNVIPYQELFNGPSTAPKPVADWYDPVDIFYTSGTTGVSKGVVLSHNHHYTFGLAIAEYARLGPKDIMYICLPLYHGMGSYMCIMPMLLCEGSIALGDRFSASRWLNEIREYGATITWAVYSMAPILMKQPERSDDADNPLKVYLFSGMPPDLVEPFERRFGVKVIDQYGSTESADIVHTPWDERRPGAVGPINTAYYDIKIVNEYDEEVPVGEVGECVSRCKYPYMQMTEYYKMPEETVKTFRNRWLHSGDMCRVDKDGWLYFVGRGKDTIRRRGENISCYEMETILSSHQNIFECAAIPVPSQLGEDEIKVVVSPREGKRLDFQEIMKFCEEKMPKFMIPRYIEMVPEIPKLPNEKVDKERLKKEGLTSKTWDAETGEYIKPGQ